jgi:hypothetical protein
MKQIGPTKFPKHQVSWESVVLGLFMRRHHKLNLRQPQLTAMTRGSGLNDVVVHTIFDMSANIVDENKITDMSIFSMEETSHTVLQRPEKIMS